MAEELDLIDEQKIATSVASKAIEALIKIVDRPIRERWAKHKNKTTKEFSRYIEKKLLYCRKIRNYIHDTRTVDIQDIYVDVGLSQPRGHTMTEEFMKRVFEKVELEINGLPIDSRDSRVSILLGTAGTGKSLFLKNLFSELVRFRPDKIPMLLELRGLNRKKTKPIAETLLDELQSYGADVSLDQVVDGLRAGMFVVMLDGFDELKPILQEHYWDDFLELSKKYERCPIILTGRPANVLKTTPGHDVYRMRVFELEHVLELVSNLELDEEIKDQFSRLIE